MTSSSPISSSNPLLRRIVLILGWLSLVATLALLSPGVVLTANAEEAEPAAAIAGPSCPIASAADERTSVELAHMIERLRTEVAEKRSDGGVVSLNTTGFNYPTGLEGLQDDSSR
jgi:hypothetical protein